MGMKNIKNKKYIGYTISRKCVHSNAATAMYLISVLNTGRFRVVLYYIL